MSFFESIGMADMEKIHSQTIAWLFSSDCNAMSSAGKERILSSILSGTNISAIKNVYTEYKSIDIVIETDRQVIAIENKIKSNQHSNQLERYKTILCEDFIEKDKVYLFLTLVPEVPKSSGWKNISYQSLSEEMEEQYRRDGERKTTDGVIFVEYLSTIKSLAKVVSEFELDHMKFENVFTDGGLKKHEKIEKSQSHEYSMAQKYVQTNQLETLLQKRFFSRILKAFGEKYEVTGRVDETRGNALIHIIVEELVYEGRPFEIGYQIQGNTMKFVFQAATETYHLSKKEWISQAVIEKMEELKDLMAYKRVNKPKRHAYISMSKKMAKNIWEYEFEELIDLLLQEYRLLMMHKEDLIKSVIG